MKLFRFKRRLLVSYGFRDGDGLGVGRCGVTVFGSYEIRDLELEIMSSGGLANVVILSVRKLHWYERCEKQT